MQRTLVCVFVLLGASVAAAGPKQEARAKLARAMEAHKQGRFGDALVDLQAAYKLDPKPDLLYAIGQVYVKLGNCDEAANAYKHFLATSKDKDMPAMVAQALAACAPAEPPPPLAPLPTPPAAPTVAAAPPPPPPVTAVAPPAPTPFVRSTPAEVIVHTPARSPWYADKLGDALVVGGVAAAAVGVVLYTRARSNLDDAEAATTLDRYNSLSDQAHTDRTYSVVLAGAGAALVAGGVLHYMLHTPAERSSVGIAPSRGGGVVTWTGGF